MMTASSASQSTASDTSGNTTSSFAPMSAEQDVDEARRAAPVRIAVECLVFMRMVGSRVLLNQMRGRAVRTMDDDDFWQVTPAPPRRAKTKDYSVLVDAVGLTDEDVVIAESSPTAGDPTGAAQDPAARHRYGPHR